MLYGYVYSGMVGGLSGVMATEPNLNFIFFGVILFWGWWGWWPTTTHFFICFFFIFLTIHGHFQIFGFLGQRRQINWATNLPGIRWPDFVQIAASLTLASQQNLTKLWLLLTFAYGLNLTNRSHQRNQDDEIYNLNLVRETSKQFYFWASISPLCPVWIYGAT